MSGAAPVLHVATTDRISSRSVTPPGLTATPADLVNRYLPVVQDARQADGCVDPRRTRRWPSHASAGKADDESDKLRSTAGRPGTKWSCGYAPPGAPYGIADRQCFGADRNPRRAAIVTSSGSESAFILRIT